MTKDDSMLLVLPVPYRRVGDTLLLEAQACNGLERWAENFSSLVAACPVLPERLATSDGSQVWRDVREIHCTDRVQFVPLPWAFSLGEFLHTYGPTRRLLRHHVEHCRYLQFALWGFLGDWASVAALEAIRLGREYALHIDSVNHVISRRSAMGHGFKRRIKAEIEAPLMKWLHAHLARHCSLGLWHGNDTFKVYSRWCKNSHTIHDVHTKPENCISRPECEAKAQEALSAPALRVCYAGRALPIKGPLDWVRAIARARDLGASIEGIWIGDGPALGEMRALAKELGLERQIEFPGFVSDRECVLDTLRRGHLMPFAHLTPESPRCLIESLLSGTPIVGYDNAFARDLLDGHGGGVLTPMKDWEKLGGEIARLAKDRRALAALIIDAGKNGARFNDETVFRERSELIKRYLP